MNRRKNQPKHRLPQAEKERELRQWCDDRGVELRITNERQHWQFRRGPSGVARTVVNWWPSTGRLRDAVDKDYFRVLVGDLGSFLASNFPPLEEPPFEVADEDDVPSGETPENEQNTWDYFAAAAIQGVCADPREWREACAAEYCANVADAMMAERARRER